MFTQFPFNMYKTNIYLKILLILLPSIFFLLNPYSFDPPLEIRSAGISLWISIVYIVFLIKRKNIAIAPITRYLSIFFILFITLLTISALQAVCLSDAIAVSIRFFLFFNIAFITEHWLSSDEKHKLLFVIYAAAIISIILAVTAFLELWFPTLIQLPGGKAPHSFASNRNLLASLLLLTYPFSLALLLQLKNNISVVLGIVAAIVSTAVLVFVQSRAVWLGYMGSAILCILLFGKEILFFFRRNPGRLQVLVITIAIGVLLGIMHVKSIPTEDSTIGKRFVSIADKDHVSNSIRLDLWKRSFTIFKQKPLWGVGPGNWRSHILEYGSHEYQTAEQRRIPVRAHNDIIQLASELGLPAILMVISGYFFLLILLLKKCSWPPPPFQNQSWKPIILWVLVSYGAVSLFSYPTTRIAHPLILFITIGILAHFTNHHKIHTNLPGTLRYGVVTIGLIVSLFSFSFFLQRLISETKIFKDIAAFESGQCGQNLLYTNVTRFRPYETTAMGVPITYYKGSCYLTKNQIPRAIESLKIADSLQAGNIHTLNNLGVCYLARQEYDSALFYINGALRFFPCFEDALLNKAVSLVKKGSITDGIDVLEEIPDTCKTQKIEQLLNILKKRNK